MTQNQEGHMLIRFRALKHRRLLPDRYYPWSGWFHWEGDPIELEWESLKSLPLYEYERLIPNSDEVDEWIDRKMREDD